MYGWSVLPFTYVLSFLFNVASTAYTWLLVINLFTGKWANSGGAVTQYVAPLAYDLEDQISDSRAPAAAPLLSSNILEHDYRTNRLRSAHPFIPMG